MSDIYDDPYADVPPPSEEGNESGAPRGHRVILTAAADILDDVPVWAWEYSDKGRIQLGTLALFAGRPGAGKSTAARWFAAGFSRGTLPGCWLGTPQHVAYIAAEESARYTVKPGLRAATADLGRIYFPSVEFDGQQVRLQSVRDEEVLTEELLDRDITVVFVDPVMSTIGTNIDIHRSNEVRTYIEPWARIADRIGGIVSGVVHLNKASSGDVVAGVNGSSAFGEVPRAVFGFAKDPESEEGDRIMSQAKNSAGEEDLAVTYRIESQRVTTDSGKSADVGRFVITGESDRTVGDVLRDAAPSSPNTEAQNWLSDYLTQHGRVRSRDAKDDAKKERFSESAIDRAARKLKVVAEPEGFPRVTFWSLPQSRQQSPQGSKGDVTDVIDSTGDDLRKQDDVTGPDSAVTSVTSVASCPREGDATGPEGCPNCGDPLGLTGKCVACIVRKVATA